MSEGRRSRIVKRTPLGIGGGGFLATQGGTSYYQSGPDAPTFSLAANSTHEPFVLSQGRSSLAAQSSVHHLVPSQGGTTLFNRGATTEPDAAFLTETGSIHAYDGHDADDLNPSPVPPGSAGVFGPTHDSDHDATDDGLLPSRSADLLARVASTSQFLVPSSEDEDDEEEDHVEDDCERFLSLPASVAVSDDSDGFDSSDEEEETQDDDNDESDGSDEQVESQEKVAASSTLSADPAMSALSANPAFAAARLSLQKTHSRTARRAVQGRPKPKMVHWFLENVFVYSPDNPPRAIKKIKGSLRAYILPNGKQVKERWRCKRCDGANVAAPFAPSTQA